MPGSTGKGAQPAAVARWEWAIAAFGAVVVAGTAGYLAWHAIAYEPTPPQLSVEVTSVLPSGDGFVVTFTMRNDGNSTAADVMVRGALRADGRTIEESEAQLPFVPSRSVRKGGLVFGQDPRRYELTIRPTGYSDP